WRAGRDALHKALCSAPRGVRFPWYGPVEASFAGARGVRLGGTLSYAGRVEHRPVLNGGGRAVEVGDIERAVRLSQRVGRLALGVSVAGRLLVNGLRTKGRTS
ncbi:hypothetical protein O3Q52_29930, partial [Streptomyces sp. ActVer]|uniref:cobalamin biosynthesis protein n=1 Tax=Streptomyces sp. ActVer TaxID=3014558 RepID=UPI0022BC8241|nr:hypothetical protein [Streptomyces sp. ActVer]